MTPSSRYRCPLAIVALLVVLPASSVAAQDRVSGEHDAWQELVAAYESGEAKTSDELAAVAAALVHLGRDDPRRFRQALRVYDEAVAADPSNLDVQVELGDLFLAKYNGTDARETFEKILAQAPEHTGALLGMARVLRFEGASDVSEPVLKSLELDPDLVEAHLLLARQHIEHEDYAAADEEAERALATEPRSPQAHALLAASALLAGDGPDFQGRLARAEEIAPGDPDVFVTLAEVAARNRLYHRAVELADRAVLIDAKSWRGWALRGVNRLRVGEIERGRRELETAFAGDPFDVWTKNTLDLLDQMAGYQVVSTKRFQLVVPADEADLLALYLGPLAEEAYDRLAGLYGVAPSAPVRLEVFPRHADFSVRTIGLVGLGALGVCFGPVIALDSPTARPAGEIHWGSVFWHELAHTFHMEASAHRVPRWLTEGLAVFEERRARPGWGDRVEPEFLIAYKRDRLAPVEDLNQGFMRPSYPQQIGFSYYQASLVCDYVAERWGFPAIVAMLKSYGTGQSTSEVFENVLGTDLESFAEAYDEYFRERFAGPLAALRLSDDEAPTLDDFKRRAEKDPGDFLAHLAVGHAFLEEGGEVALPYLERARELFPSYAGEASPYWLLAQVHKKAGRLAEAAAQLQALTERNQGHYAALAALAEVRAELEDVAGAARALQSVLYVYPYEADDHRQLAEWLETLGEGAEAVRERRAVLALHPFNRSEALYQLARAQLVAGDRSAARSTVLEALELAPNYDEALTFLLELRGGGP